MVPLSAELKSCKGKTDTANNTKSILSNLDKGHLFRVKGGFGLNYNSCCTSSAALICHQPRAVTTELLLHHCLFCHPNQKACVATQTGNVTRMLQQATLEHDMMR